MGSMKKEAMKKREEETNQGRREKIVIQPSREQ